MLKSMMNSDVFNAFCRYREGLKSSLPASVEVAVCNEEQFEEIWRNLGSPERGLWLSKFEQGYESVSNSQKARLIEAFTSGSERKLNRHAA